ncbi:MAG: L,D-transpeptidase [Halobacteriovoraceae bacterium]|nr:L,D-transpeptidase [Halobacteriovoraceae bacterium]
MHYGLFFLMAGLFVSCGDSRQNFNKHTDNDFNPFYVSSLENAEEVKVGEVYYVHADGLRLRSTDSTEDDENIIRVLSRNEKVKVRNLNLNLAENFVEVEVISKSNISEIGFVSFRYLEKTPSTAPVKFSEDSNKYFIIQNIATERIRLYERNFNGGPHRIILESELAVGEDDKTSRSILGTFKIVSWHKFYRDNLGRYPSWYDPDMNEILPPLPGLGWRAWFSDKYTDGASMRGAFGWFTAKVAPRASSQWIHGTIGWGEEKRKYIFETKEMLANIFASPRSHGCSRTDNETIAYINSFVPVGTLVFKVYAKEFASDKYVNDYSKPRKIWNYILTKNGVRTDGQKADAEVVLSDKTPVRDFLEVGNYSIDSFPNAVKLDSTSGFLDDFRRKIKETGNVYGISDSQFVGTYDVTTGKLFNYRHPSVLTVGGYEQFAVNLPNFVTE